MGIHAEPVFACPKDMPLLMRVTRLDTDPCFYRVECLLHVHNRHSWCQVATPSLLSSCSGLSSQGIGHIHGGCYVERGKS